MSLVDGSWYVRIVGDFAGRVSGAVYNMQNESDPSQLPVQVSAAEGGGCISREAG